MKVVKAGVNMAKTQIIDEKNKFSLHLEEKNRKMGVTGR